MDSQGKIDSAIRCYTRASELDCSDAHPASYVAAALLKADRLDEAMGIFEVSIRRFPNDPAVRNDFGLLLGGQDRISEAAEQFREAIRLDPSFTPARINLANALFAQGKFKEAAEQLHAVVAIDPENFEAFHNSGIMLCQLHDYSKAEPMLRRRGGEAGFRRGQE